MPINFSSAFKGVINKFSSTTSIENYANGAGVGVVGGVLFYNANGTPTAVLSAGSSGAEVVTAANVITAAESGKTFFLNSATEFASTLPAPALGLRFDFIVAAAPSGASYTVAAASGTPIHGMVLSKDLNGATDSGATAGTGVLTLTFVDSKAQKGDRATFISDGTSWFVTAFTGGNFDAITLS
jgi:hypothetical protein